MMILMLLVLMMTVEIYSQSSSSCKCGIRRLPQGIKPIISVRIAGGEDAEPNEFPWVARIFVRGVLRNFTCGATLINDR